MANMKDKAADWLGDHPAAHHLRGKRWLEILGSVLLSLGVLGLIGVWAAATEGYESTSEFSPNFNLTDNDHWYSDFIPGRTGQLCQPAFINTGSQFYTTNGIFLWEMGKAFNVSGVAANGNNDTMVNFNGTLKQYADNKLDHCDVSGMAIDMDLMQASIRVQLYATCIDPKWPALLHSQTTFSVDQSRLLDPSLWFNEYLVANNSNGSSISSSLNDLAEDLWNRQRAVYLRGSEVLPTIRGLRLLSDRNCAMETENKTACYESAVTYNNESVGFFMTPNLTITTVTNDTVDWNITTNNFIQALFAAARYDFGINMTNNLFSNGQARSSVIQTVDNVDNSTTLMNSLTGAMAFLDAPVYPQSTVSRIQTSYLCVVMKMKPPATFVMSVLGFTLAIFGAAFAVAVAAVKFLTGKHFGVPVVDRTIHAVTSRLSSSTHRRGASGGSAVGNKGASSDEYSRSAADSTPAPSTYIGGHAKEGSGSEMLYSTPLNDKSRALGGSDTASSMTLKDRFSSFGSLSKFTDRGASSAANSPATGLANLPFADKFSGFIPSGAAAGLVAGGAAGGLTAAAAGHFAGGSGDEEKALAAGAGAGAGGLAANMTSEPWGFAKGMMPASMQNMVPANIQGMVPANLQGMVPANLQGMVPANMQNMAANVQGMVPANMQNMAANVQGMVPANVQGMVPAGVAGGLAGVVPANVRNMVPTQASDVFASAQNATAAGGVADLSDRAAAISGLPAQAQNMASNGWGSVGTTAAGVAAAGAAGVAGFAAASHFGKDQPQTTPAPVASPVANAMTQLPVDPATAQTAAVETAPSNQLGAAQNLDPMLDRKASTGSGLSRRVSPPPPISIPAAQAAAITEVAGNGTTFATPASPTASGPPVFSPKQPTRAAATSAGPPLLSPKTPTVASPTAPGAPVSARSVPAVAQNEVAAQAPVQAVPAPVSQVPAQAPAFGTAALGAGVAGVAGVGAAALAANSDNSSAQPNASKAVAEPSHVAIAEPAAPNVASGPFNVTGIVDPATQAVSNATTSANTFVAGIPQQVSAAVPAQFSSNMPSMPTSVSSIPTQANTQVSSITGLVNDKVAAAPTFISNQTSNIPTLPSASSYTDTLTSTFNDASTTASTQLQGHASNLTGMLNGATTTAQTAVQTAEDKAKASASGFLGNL